MSSQLIRANSGLIPELTADPSNPSPQKAWVLKTQSGSGPSGGGKMIAYLGLGFPYLVAGSGGSITLTYQFSYMTLEGTTKRVTLS